MGLPKSREECVTNGVEHERTHAPEPRLPLVVLFNVEGSMRPLAVAASHTYHNAVDVDSNVERIDPVEVDTKAAFFVAR